MKLNINIPAKLQNALMTVTVIGVAILLISSRTYKKSIKPEHYEIHIETLKDDKNLLTEAEVLAHLQKTLQYHPVKLAVGDTKLERFEEIISEIPYVKKADVYLDHNATLHFRIKQKMPVLRIVQNGRAHYVSKEGSLVPLSAHYTIRVPLLHGNIPAADKNWPQELQRIIEVFSGSETWERQIDQIYRQKDGSYVLIPVLSDVKIDFGKWENVDEKLEKLDQFFDEVIPVKGWSKYERIDLRFKDQVIAKMKV